MVQWNKVTITTLQLIVILRQRALECFIYLLPQQFAFDYYFFS